ncbi:hypothetical protein Q7F20_01845 [Curtobacterium sp. A7_M15]|jgi:hypothetical protein|uniref:hypothetical protein n=1 Tax=Curtobacterium sp. A7_M15 TaxID=3065241 RepID=UPI0027377E62|nr:hypothetical protein [Curtobacterium sp. A7_M15]MDP4332099.1 hypothetical protein [Curtobacterium sp. A7_M15]
MSEDAGGEQLWRSIVGRPALWMAVAWTALGVVWLVFAGVEGHGEVWRWIIGGVWIALGVGRIAVAVWDRRHRRGRYVGR